MTVPPAPGSLDDEAAPVAADRPADPARRATARQGRRARRLQMTALAVVILAAPAFLGDQLLTVGVFAGIFALAALGLQLMMGLAGQANLGQAGFFAIGAYTSAILVSRYGWNALFAGALAIVLTVAAALIVGVPLLRLKGYYLALATFGFGIIVAVLANELPFLGHATGIFGVPKPSIGGFSFSEPQRYFYLVWAFAAVAVLLAQNLVRSRKGRALAAVHDSEIAAETLGVNTFRLRLEVLLVCAALASVAGSLYVHWVSVINPAAASFLLSIRFIVMAAVGGLLSVWGAIIGAVTIQGLGEALHVVVPRFVGGSSGEIQLIVFGVILAAVLAAMPGGITSVVEGLLDTARRRLGGALTRPSAVPPARQPTRSSLDAAARGVLVARDGRPESGTSLLAVRDVSRHFGGVRAVHQVDLDVEAGQIVALIGPNGAGKTTLFNVISGVLEPTSGSVTIGGERAHGLSPHRIAQLRTARTFQNLEIFGSMTVLDNVKVGRHLRSRAGVLAGATSIPARREERAIEARSLALVELVGLGDVTHDLASELPFGRQRLVEIARALAVEPDLLLLDEPMAGLTADERSNLADLLDELRGEGLGILLVEHDVEAVMALADTVVVLDNGTRIAVGPPESVRSDPAVLEAYLGVDLDFSDIAVPR